MICTGRPIALNAEKNLFLKGILISEMKLNVIADAPSGRKEYG